MSTSELIAYGSAFLAIVGLILTIVGIVLTIKSKRTRKPCYHIRTTPLITERPYIIPGLKVSYKDEDINSLSSSYLFVWNEGREPIRKQDIPDNHPPTIAPIVDAKILACQLVYTHSPANTFSTYLCEGTGTASINVDYIDYNDGAIFAILHTGSIGSLSLNGSIIGGGNFLERNRQRYTIPTYLGSGLFGLLVGSTLVYIILSALGAPDQIGTIDKRTLMIVTFSAQSWLV